MAADHAALPNQDLSRAVLACVILCIAVRFWWCRRLTSARPGTINEFGQFEVMKMAWVGASIPQAICMLAWPLYPAALRVVTDAPLLLIPTGFSALVLVIGDVFDWKK